MKKSNMMMLAGIICSIAVHLLIMIPNWQPAPFSSTAGIILGWIAAAVITRKNIKPETTNE